MQSSPVDEIKNRLDILEVVGSYIKLAKAGRNYRARCPFHSERTPSFMVSPERQIWHCFGCGLGGDIFAFVKQIEGVEFGDALRILAHRAGVVLKRQDPAIQTQRKRLYEICELSAKFFEKQMDSKTGQQAYKYLTKERGLKLETIKQWRLGWAPDEWRALSQFLRGRGYSDEEILQAGLSVHPENSQDTKYKIQNTNYDRFRSRIIFPLFDIQGQIVGFAGRIFGKEDQNSGKYINTPQTILYDKSRLLYGLNFAKVEIRKLDACVLVEGNLDVIMSRQAGSPNAIATSGTALTQEHLNIIKRYTENLLFSFDTDTAGENATRRSIELALENDFSVKVIEIKEKDPADLIKQNPAAWLQALGRSVSILEHYFSVTFAKSPSASSGQASAEDKKQIAKILLPVIKKITNQIEKSHWISELAKRLKTNEKLLYSEMQKIKNEAPSFGQRPPATAPAQTQKSRADELEERIISLFLHFPQHLKDFPDSDDRMILNQDLAKIFEELTKTASKNEDSEKCLKNIAKKLSVEACAKVDYLTLKAEEFPLEEASAAQELAECQKELKLIRLKQKMNELGFEIQEAQAKKDKTKLAKNLEKFKKLSKELIELN